LEKVEPVKKANSEKAKRSPSSVEENEPPFPKELVLSIRSSLYSSYSYSVTSPLLGFTGAANAQSLFLEIGAEYHFKRNWSLGLDFEVSNYLIGDSTYYAKSLDSYIERDFPLFQPDSKWKLGTQLGFEYREYFESFPTGFSPSFPTRFGTLGPTLGLSIERQLGDRINLGLAFDFYLPVALLGTSAGSSLSISPFANYKITLEGEYNLGKGWDLTVGGSYDQRGISYSPVSVTGISQDVIGISNPAVFGGINYHIK